MLNFEDILRMTQKELKKALAVELKRLRYKPISKDGFIYAEGKIPIMLIAHLDTVHKNIVKTICYSPNGRIIMSPDGIGGDDRCGVYMILQIIKKQRCHVLFCEDEEIGGIGATKFATSGIKPNIDYMIELDRRGNNDAVFYECDNRDFTEYIKSFGFMEEFGSFSDISVIAPELGVAAVNISAGFFNEHTKHEYIDTQVMRDNIKRVTKIVTSNKSRKFEYIEAYGYYNFKGYNWISSDFGYFSNGKKITKEDKSINVMFDLLSQLPESCYIKTADGEMLESDNGYLIDEHSKIYEYLYEFDVAVELDGYSAFTENGLPAKFDWDDVLEVEIASKEYAQELEYLMCG